METLPFGYIKIKRPLIHSKLKLATHKNDHVNMYELYIYIYN